MNLSTIKALTFDVFGTVLDLGGSLTPHIAAFLAEMESGASADLFWKQWRARQRIEQWQDTILMLGHSGYLETSRRALVYVLALNGIQAPTEKVNQLMRAWEELSPFPEVAAALERLSTRYRLVVLSNGDPQLLDHLVKHRIDGETVEMQPKKLDVSGKNVVILDDIISTGGTMMKAADMMKKQGAKKVFIGCVHGVFAKGTDIFRGYDVVCSNSLPGKFSKVSLAPVIIEELKRHA